MSEPIKFPKIIKISNTALCIPKDILDAQLKQEAKDNGYTSYSDYVLDKWKNKMCNIKTDKQ